MLSWFRLLFKRVSSKPGLGHNTKTYLLLNSYCSVSTVKTMSTTTSTELVPQLKTIIAEELDVNLTVEEIDDNVSLFEEGLGFDSIAIVEFISAIEKHFDIEFDDSELDPENFKSLQVLADLIAGKVDA